MANDLCVSIVADASGVEAGFSSAAQSVADFNQRMAAAMERYNAVAAQGKAAQEALTSAFNQASASGKTVVEAYETAAAEAEKLAAAANQAAAAENNIAAAGQRVVSGTTAANGAMRVLEGSMMGSTRAAGSFLATTLGLGPALESAFPVIGAAALGIVLVDVAGQVVKFGKDAEDLAERLNTNWLKGAAVELEGLRGEVRQLDADIEKLYSDIDKNINKQKELGFAQLGRKFGQTGEDTFRSLDASNQARNIEPFLQQAERYKQLADLAARGEFQGSRPSYRGWEEDPATRAANKAEAEHDKINVGNPEVAAKEAEKAAVAIEAMQTQIATLHAAATDFAEKAANLGVDNVTAAAKAGKPTWDAGTALMQDSRLQKEAEEQISEALSQTATKQINAEMEADKQKTEAEKRAGEEGKRQQQEQLEIAALHSEELQKQAEYAARINDLTTEHNERMGLISPSQATKQRLGTLDTETSTQTSAIQQQMAGLDPSAFPQQEKQYEALNNRRADITRQGAVKQLQIMQQEAQQQEQQFQRMFTAMTGPMNTFVDHWLTSGKRMSAAFAQMGDQMAMNFINAEMRMLESHLRIELQKLAATTAGNTAQAANTTAANAEKAASDTATADKSIAKKAADAAAGAWNALSNIPIIGPELGAVAAAATWTGVMALAAFETGTNYVPKTGMALIHEGEAVANRGEASDMRKLISMGQRSQQGGDNHFHMGTTINALDGSGVESVANRNSTALMKAIRRQMRLQGRIQ